MPALLVELDGGTVVVVDDPSETPLFVVGNTMDVVVDVAVFGGVVVEDVEVVVDVDDGIWMVVEVELLDVDVCAPPRKANQTGRNQPANYEPKNQTRRSSHDNLFTDHRHSVASKKRNCFSWNFCGYPVIVLKIGPSHRLTKAFEPKATTY